MNRQWFNLPNRITLARLLASVVLFVMLACIPQNGTECAGPMGYFALALFVLVAASDWLDGYLARKYGQVTTIGRILDPFVDKVAVCGAYVMLLRSPVAPLLESWTVVVIVAREFFVNDSRGWFESKGVSFGAEAPGKIKMMLQCVSVSLLLAQLAFGNLFGILRGVNIALLWIVLVATVASGVFYMRKGMVLIREAEG
jgi:CDP-diacylglycerol--glycerol-3-phosphate 3-phosphatidyltransferase